MATKEENDDLTRCPICFEKYSNPKYLPCLHTFCMFCVKSYIQTQVGKEGENFTCKSFPCPVCRQLVQIPDYTVSVDEFAKLLPSNHLITSLMDQSRAGALQENPGTMHGETERGCDPCKLDNMDVPATTWCTVCLEPLCDTCASYHKRLKQSRDHMTVPFSDGLKTQSGIKISDADEPCEEHKGKMYCVDHKEMCCVICLATQHRRCENITTFEEMVKDQKYGTSVEIFREKLLEVERKTEGLRVNAEENINDLERKQGEISEEVSALVQIVIDKLETVKRGFLSEFQSTHKQQVSLLEERKGKIEIFQSFLQRGYKLIQTVCNGGSPKQVFITMEKLKMQIQRHLEQFGHELHNDKIIDYELQIDDILNTVLKSSLSSIGQVDLKLTPHCSDYNDDIMFSFGENADINDMEVKKLFDVNISSAFVLGGTFVPDGRLVLCDYSNRKLLLVCGNAGNILSEKKLPDIPFDASTVGNEEILVSFANNQFIKRYGIQNNTFYEKAEVSCKQGPEGIAVCKDKIIIGYRSSIDVITFDDKNVRIITKSPNDRSCLAVGKDNLYYNEVNDVVCGSLDGQELFRFTNANLKYAAGISVDHRKNVIICGYNSGNVHLVNADGTKSKVLIAKINHPFAVGFNSDSKHFFLTTVGTLQNDSVAVYNLSVKGKDK